MHVEKNNDMIPKSRTSFFRIVKREEELDESTFNMWKSELEKDLPGFWESMIKKHGR